MAFKEEQIITKTILTLRELLPIYYKCVFVCEPFFEGLYRGNIVAVKQILKRSVDLTRAIRKELKQMREV